MPEGHSVHRHARLLSALFEGEAIRTSSPQGRFTVSAVLMDHWVAGRALAWGKHLFMPVYLPEDAAEIDLSTSHIGSTPDAVGATRKDGSPAVDTAWLHVHLGLYGKWRMGGPAVDAFHEAELSSFAAAGGAVPAEELAESADPDYLHRDHAATLNHAAGWVEPTATTRLYIHTDTAAAALTGPAACELVDKKSLAARIAKLGPDPIRNEPGDRERFIATARKRRIPIGQVVMDQGVVAGPGNIYRADCLWRVQIDPLRPANEVSEAELGALWDDLAESMSKDVDSGLIITVPDEYRPAETLEADPELDRFAVYHRTGRPCVRCGTPIREEKLAGRNLFWCPGCQH